MALSFNGVKERVKWGVRRKNWILVVGAAFVILILVLSGSLNRRRELDLGVSPPELMHVAEPVMGTRWSVVSTMLQADRGQLQSFLEAEAEDWSYVEKGRELEVPFGEAESDLEVILDGKPQVDLKTGLMVLEVPLRVVSRVHWEGELFGLNPSMTEKVEGALVARVFLRPRFTFQWLLETHARVEFDWTREPAVELLGYRVSLKKWISPVLDDWLRENAGRFDEEINEELRLGERASEEWEKLGEPFELRSDPGLWLSIEPLAVHIPPPDIEEGYFRARILIPLGLRLISGEKPASTDPGPLPPLKTDTPRMDGLNLAVPILLRYEDLESEAKRHFTGWESSVEEDGVLRVEDVSLQGGGGELLVGLDLTGRKGKIEFSGRVYLRGSPTYDAETGLVSIGDLCFDVITEDRLSQVASWLLKPYFVDNFREKLVFSVETLLAEARNDLEEDWKEQRLDKNFVLRGSILGLRLTRVFPAMEGLMLEVEATGQATLDFEPE